MRLLHLFEAPEEIWYHGTPEMQKIEDQFENRTINVSYISDPEKWNQLQAAMKEVERGSDKYFKLLDQAGKLKQYKTVRSPIFFTNNTRVARSYADDRRAFDYQQADPGIIRARIKPGKTLSIDGAGQNFRGITVDSVRRGLQNAGISDEVIDDSLAQFSDQIRGDGNKISTDSLAAIVDHLGFEIVDVLRIKDTYMGEGPPATVRMVLNPDLVEIIGDRANESISEVLKENALQWGGCWIKPDGEILHLEPNPHEPVHHAELVFDDPELDAIVDQRAMDDDGEYSDDTREIAVNIGLEAGWIRIRTHASGNQFLVQHEHGFTRPALRSFREYLDVYRGYDQFMMNDQQYDSAKDLMRSVKQAA